MIFPHINWHIKATWTSRGGADIADIVIIFSISHDISPAASISRDIGLILHYITSYQHAYHDIACNTALRCCRLEGVPPMESYQHKRRRLVRSKTAGVQLNDFLDLQRWAEAHELPAKREDMAPFEVYSVPIDWTDFLTVEAVVLTCHVQVGWIGRTRRRSL